MGLNYMHSPVNRTRNPPEIKSDPSSNLSFDPCGHSSRLAWVLDLTPAAPTAAAHQCDNHRAESFLCCMITGPECKLVRTATMPRDKILTPSPVVVVVAAVVRYHNMGTLAIRQSVCQLSPSLTQIR